MSIIQGTGRGVARRFYEFPIEQSLRFDGSSYLSRTPSTAGNSHTWTWSMWFKLTNLGASYAAFIEAGESGSKYSAFWITNDKLTAYTYNSGTTIDVISTQVLRDTSSWYHLVIKLDTSSSPAIVYYLNGVPITDLDTSTYPTSSSALYVNSANPHYIGDAVITTVDGFKGYLANIQSIDGQALDASYFGETKQDIWIPKTFDGTSSTGGSTVSTDYGTNGFLLDFSSISGTTINDTAPIDTNHSSANNWTATGF
jgi:hypothetical protein